MPQLEQRTLINVAFVTLEGRELLARRLWVWDCLEAAGVMSGNFTGAGGPASALTLWLLARTLSFPPRVPIPWLFGCTQTC